MTKMSSAPNENGPSAGVDAVVSHPSRFLGRKLPRRVTFGRFLGPEMAARTPIADVFDERGEQVRPHFVDFCFWDVATNDEIDAKQRKSTPTAP